MKKILVPFDFSAPAVNAFRFALDIATKSNGAMHVVHVIELPVLYDTTLMPVLAFEESAMKDMKADAEKKFRKMADKYKAEGVTVQFSVVYGVILESLMSYIKKNTIDLVVMGSHGATGFQEMFIGSNAERVVRFAQVPVMVIKDYFKGPVNRIVFPNSLDTEKQEDLVMKVKALQDFFKAQLHVVWINTPARFQNDIETQKRLQTFAKRFMLRNYVLDVFNHFTEEEGILAYTEMVKGNLIAMGTSGRKGVAHMVNGSKAEDVVNHSKSLIWTTVTRESKKRK